MLDDFLVGLATGFLALVILAFTAILGYAVGSMMGTNPQITSAGFVIAALAFGVIYVMRRR